MQVVKPKKGKFSVPITLAERVRAEYVVPVQKFGGVLCVQLLSRDS